MGSVGDVSWRVVALLIVAQAVLGSWVVGVSAAAAADDVGVSDRRTLYRPPVAAAVIDPFRAPVGPYGPGNRGLEYATGTGAVVRSIGSGSVVFAGWVAGRLVVSVQHPDGLRSSLVGLASIGVEVGDRVEVGEVVGRSVERLHLGVRSGDTYVDPSLLFVGRLHARLVMPGERAQGGPGFRPGREGR